MLQLWICIDSLIITMLVKLSLQCRLKQINIIIIKKRKFYSKIKNTNRYTLNIILIINNTNCIIANRVRDVTLLQELGNAYAGRFRMILDKSLNMRSHGSAEFAMSLSHSEAQCMSYNINI